ncbi:MAG: ATP-binding cassette domain-containing protein [Blastocatellia bacterium]
MNGIKTPLFRLSETTRHERPATDEARSLMTLIRNTRAEGEVCCCGEILPSQAAFGGILPPSGRESAQLTFIAFFAIIGTAFEGQFSQAWIGLIWQKRCKVGSMMDNQQPLDARRVGTCAIEFRNVSVSFDDKRALSDISFQLDHGEMIAITGVASSGKSVLLRVAIGLIKPDEGQVFVEGREIEGLEEEELLEMRGRLMGMVFQEHALFTSLSVYDNAAYRLVEHNWPEEEIERAVNEILRFVGLEKEKDKLPEEMSVGMAQRLEFARAVVGWPKIMLFDEPTAGLDPINNRNLLDLIIRARDVHDISALYVTKDLKEIPYIASHVAVEDDSGSVLIKKGDGRLAKPMRVMLLEEGRIAFLGTPNEFQTSTLPAVLRMTHPDSGRPTTGESIADPWSKKRRPNDRLF